MGQQVPDPLDRFWRRASSRSAMPQLPQSTGLSRSEFVSAGDDALSIDTVDLDAGFDLDAQLLQPFGRLFGELVRVKVGRMRLPASTRMILCFAQDRFV